MTLRFYKEEGFWYVDLPEYIEQGGSKEDLLMVSGAPEFLEYLSQDRNEVSVEVHTNIPGTESQYVHLYKRRDIPVQTGAYYSTIDQFWTMWLCSVLFWIFKCYPEDLFIKTTENESITGGLGKDTSTGQEGNTPS